MKTLLFTDSFGIAQLTKFIPKTNIIGIVGASIRPQYFYTLRNYSRHLGIPFIIQPKYKSNGYSSFYKEIFNLKPDTIISHSYSMLIRKNILEIVNYNAINIHGALLPLNRGPNPLQWALIKGEKTTGVTMHYMTDKLDDGDIIAQDKVKIDFTDTWVTLSKKIEKATDELLSTNIPKFYAGKLNRRKQYETLATYNKRLNKESPLIDFTNMSNRQIYNLIRAQVSPLNGAYIIKNNKKIYFSNFVEYNKIEELRNKYTY